MTTKRAPGGLSKPRDNAFSHSHAFASDSHEKQANYHGLSTDSHFLIATPSLRGARNANLRNKKETGGSNTGVDPDIQSHSGSQIDGFAREKPQPMAGALVRHVPIGSENPSNRSNANELAQLDSWVVNWLADLLVADYLRTDESPTGTDREVA